jgi:hypothetical protein
MDKKVAQKWLENPSSSLKQRKRAEIRRDIKVRAVRAMVTEQYVRQLDDKKWSEVSELTEWKKFQNSRHMGTKLAAERDTKIFEILSTGPLQVAKDYMTATMMRRRKQEGYPHK